MTRNMQIVSYRLSYLNKSGDAIAERDEYEPIHGGWVMYFRQVSPGIKCQRGER